MVSFILMDTGGQERFRRIHLSNVAQDVDTFLLVYSVTDPESLNAVPKLISEIRSATATGENPFIFIIGNKIDCGHYDKSVFAFSDISFSNTSLSQQKLVLEYVIALRK